MKKIICSLLLFSFISTSFAQEKHEIPRPPSEQLKQPHNTIALNYGFDKTTSVEFSTTENGVIFGAGYGFYVGNEVKGESLPNIENLHYQSGNSGEVPHHAYYVLIGGKWNRFSAVGKLGLHNTKELVYFNREEPSIDPNLGSSITSDLYNSATISGHSVLVGGAVRYDVLKRLGLSLGWDNFGKANIGLGYSF